MCTRSLTSIYLQSVVRRQNFIVYKIFFSRTDFFNRIREMFNMFFFAEQEIALVMSGGLNIYQDLSEIFCLWHSLPFDYVISALNFLYNKKLFGNKEFWQLYFDWFRGHKIEIWKMFQWWNNLEFFILVWKGKKTYKKVEILCQDTNFFFL